MDLIARAVQELNQFLSASVADLQRLWGVKKVGDRYVIEAWNAPWIIKLPVSASLEPEKAYRVDGLDIHGIGAGTQIIVAVVSEGLGAGFFATKRKPIFKCSRRIYTAPIGLQLPPYIDVKPMELWASHSGVISCVPRKLQGVLAIIPESVSDLRRIRISIRQLSLVQLHSLNSK